MQAPIAPAEPRWAQLLCGPVDVQALAAAAPAPRGGDALEQRVQALEVEVAQLRELCEQLGV